jgi:hypothetical protein
MAKSTGSEFIVKLDGIKLPPETEARISQAIQSTVMSELARIDTKGDLVARIPWKDWLGIWIRSQKFDRNVGFIVNEKIPG